MKSIGEIIKTHRQNHNMSQEELGKKLFVTKQAVSKWENGKTLPDIETIRKLTEILNIPHDEILGETIIQTRRYKNYLKVIIPIAIICFLMMLFFAVDGIGIIQRRMQNGICIVTLHQNGTLIEDDSYQIVGIQNVTNGQNGFSFPIDYGEVKGIIITSQNQEIEFGFINTNSWHNVQINIDIDSSGGSTVVSQKVIYRSDDSRIDVFETNTAMDSNNKASVFRAGL